MVCTSILCLSGRTPQDMKLARGTFYSHIQISFQPRVAPDRIDFRITWLDRPKLLRQVAAAFVAFFCGSCAMSPSTPGTPFGPNDYAFMIARPYPKETQLAQKRFQNFLRRPNTNGRLTLAKTPFLAVRAYPLNANQLPVLPYTISLPTLPSKS